ncbi:MAG TPA: winged helix-turn-helix transcriptional regulator [Phenylobacterium sp.]|nr:winged helix-turn-helix transcriptional regulator [Phenylobacterium sp.]
MELEKITKKASRSYDDACGAAHALDLIGERWALLVMRELMLGPRRFSDLRAQLPGISANVLTQRLEGLEAAGIVRRARLAPPASVQVYELTEWGLEAEPILLHMGMWGARSPQHDPTLYFSPASLMLSLRAKFEPARAATTDVSLEMRFGGESYTAAVQAGRLTTARGAPARADAVVSGQPVTLIELFYVKTPLEVLEGQGRLAVEGDRGALLRFADLWEMPPKAG